MKCETSRLPGPLPQALVTLWSLSASPRQHVTDSQGPWAASLMCSHGLGGRHGWVLQRWPGACFSDPGSETLQKDHTQAIGGWGSRGSPTHLQAPPPGSTSRVRRLHGALISLILSIYRCFTPASSAYVVLTFPTCEVWSERSTEPQNDHETGTAIAIPICGDGN